jgi:hypothetical protein
MQCFGFVPIHLQTSLLNSLRLPQVLVEWLWYEHECEQGTLTEMEGSVQLTSLHIQFRSAAFDNANITYNFYKTSYLNEEPLSLCYCRSLCLGGAR